jgi:hypothetical protein
LSSNAVSLQSIHSHWLLHSLSITPYITIRQATITTHTLNAPRGSTSFTPATAALLPASAHSSTRVYLAHSRPQLSVLLFQHGNVTLLLQQQPCHDRVSLLQLLQSTNALHPWQHLRSSWLLLLLPFRTSRLLLLLLLLLLCD